MKFDPTYDYGNADLAIELNLVYWKFGELIKTLITLASNADRQIDIMGVGVITDEMAEDFYSYSTLSQEAFIQNGLLDENAVEKLNQLDHFFDQRSDDKDPDFWDDAVLATHEDWEHIRKQAQDILVCMDFGDLDIAFDRSEKYVTTDKGHQQLVVQSTKTRLINKKSAG